MGRFLRIEALIVPAIAVEAVDAVGHELPHAARARASIHDLRLKAGFGHGLVDQILGNILFRQHRRDHGVITAGPLQRPHQRSPALRREIADKTGDRIVDHQRQVGLRGLEFCDRLRLDRRVHRESDIVGDIDRRRFDLGCESITLLERLGLQRIDSVENAIELIVQLGFVPQIEIAGQHQVDSAVEVCLGGLQLARVVVSHTALIRLFDCVDQGLHLRTGGGRCRRGSRGSGRSEGLAGLSAGAVAWGDSLCPGVTGFSGTHPVNSNEAAASTGMNTLRTIFNPLDKPMRNRLGTLRLATHERPCSCWLACLIVLPGTPRCE